MERFKEMFTHKYSRRGDPHFDDPWKELAFAIISFLYRDWNETRPDKHEPSMSAASWLRSVDDWGFWEWQQAVERWMLERLGQWQRSGRRGGRPPYPHHKVMVDCMRRALLSLVEDGWLDRPEGIDDWTRRTCTVYGFKETLAERMGGKELEDWFEKMKDEYCWPVADLSEKVERYWDCPECGHQNSEETPGPITFEPLAAVRCEECKMFVRLSEVN